MRSPMEKETGGAVGVLGRLPMPAVIVLGALTLVGAVTVVQWIVTIFAWLVTLLMILVVLVGLAFWGFSGKSRD